MLCVRYTGAQCACENRKLAFHILPPSIWKIALPCGYYTHTHIHTHTHTPKNTHTNTHTLCGCRHCCLPSAGDGWGHNFVSAVITAGESTYTVSGGGGWGALVFDEGQALGHVLALPIGRWRGGGHFNLVRAAEGHGRAHAVGHVAGRRLKRVFRARATQAADGVGVIPACA